jgi:hypothetical protein
MEAIYCAGKKAVLPYMWWTIAIVLLPNVDVNARKKSTNPFTQLAETVLRI